MVLFLITCIMVFAVSYLIISMTARKKSINAVIYFLISAFAQVVLDFEILSLFNAISVKGVLTLNVLSLAAALLFWNKSGRPLYTIDLKEFFKKFLNSLKLDKYLMVLFAGWLVFIVVSLFLTAIMPVVNADASAYHVLRSSFWVLNGNLNHFDIPDSRNLLLPINSEILYAWVILFTKRLAFFGFFSFAGYILSITSLYGVLKLMHFSMRVRLWTIFILSSFAGVIVQASGTETDLIISGLVFSSLYLYWKALKNNEKMPIFFSALSYALALGTKSTAFMAVPGVGLFMIALGIYYKKKEFYKPFILFLSFGILNFIVFSFYNYVLNFINYSNFIGSIPFLEAHQNHQGLRAIPANFVKYIFLFFDFTGFRWGEYIGDKILYIRDSIIAFMNLSDILDGIYNPGTVKLNQSLLEPLMGLGILGFLVYLPCWIWSFIKPIFKHKKQVYFILGFAILLLINLIVMSYQLQYMVYSIRFLLFFCVISSPVLVWSYFKKNSIIKFLIVLFAMFYLTLVSTHLWARPFNRIAQYFKAGATIYDVRHIANCSNFIFGIKNEPESIKKLPFIDAKCAVRDYLANLGKDNKIMYFANNTDQLLPVNMLNLNGYQIDFGLMEDIESIDFNKYNAIIIMRNQQFASNVKHYETRKNDVYVNPMTKSVYYRKNEENPCFYYDKSEYNIADVNNPKIKPCFVQCLFKNEFYNKIDYKLIDKLNINNHGPEKPDADEFVDKSLYYIYENKKNPLKS